MSTDVAKINVHPDDLTSDQLSDIDTILRIVETSHGNSRAFRFAIQELRRLNDAAAEPMVAGHFDETVSMLRHSRTRAKCREGCLRILRAIAGNGGEI